MSPESSISAQLSQQSLGAPRRLYSLDFFFDFLNFRVFIFFNFRLFIKKKKIVFIIAQKEIM